MNPGFTAALITAFLILLSACASPQAFQSAPSSTGRYQLGPHPAEGLFGQPMRYLDDRQSIGYVQNGGGVGLLLEVFRPLGLALDLDLIAAKSDKDQKALKRTLGIDVYRAFALALSESAIAPVSGSSSDILLSPYLYLVNVDDDHILTAASLHVDMHPTGRDWDRKYEYELPEIYTKAQLAAGLTESQFSSLQADLTVGLRWGVETYLKDAQGALPLQQNVTVKSKFLMPWLDAALLGDVFNAGPGRCGFAGPRAIVSLIADRAKITPQKC